MRLMATVYHSYRPRGIVEQFKGDFSSGGGEQLHLAVGDAELEHLERGGAQIHSYRSGLLF